MGNRGSHKKKKHDTMGPQVNIVMMGNGGVGKTALVKRFLENDFTQKYSFQKEDDTYTYPIEIDGENYSFEIVDTLGREVMNDLYIKNGHFFMIVYSIVSNNGYCDVPDTIEQIWRVKDEDFRNIMIVSNKSDLEDQRIVPTEHGRKLAEKIGVAFVEVSAKTGEGVQEMFRDMIRFGNDHSYICGQNNINIKRAK